ncbi:MAG TPA: DUF2721 domain-containing protein [Candidatus Solibacter sp.]|jgi:hypothetical protein|nr:DUF2721 domain-containing protein [Candidatus Solibacter sp.]
MFAPVSESPFAVLTLIAAPAVFTNASSVLALGTGNRLARVVDRTRQLAKDLHAEPPTDDASSEMWSRHLGRLEKRAALLVRAMSFFYGAIGAFATASAVSILGASLSGSGYTLPFALIGGISFLVGMIGFVGLSVGCTFLVTETRLALMTQLEEARLARRWLK